MEAGGASDRAKLSHLHTDYRLTAVVVVSAQPTGGRRGLGQGQAVTFAQRVSMWVVCLLVGVALSV